MKEGYLQFWVAALTILNIHRNKVIFHSNHSMIPYNWNYRTWWQFRQIRLKGISSAPIHVHSNEEHMGWCGRFNFQGWLHQAKLKRPKLFSAPVVLVFQLSPSWNTTNIWTWEEKALFLTFHKLCRKFRLARPRNLHTTSPPPPTYFGSIYFSAHRRQPRHL